MEGSLFCTFSGRRATLKLMDGYKPPSIRYFTTKTPVGEELRPPLPGARLINTQVIVETLNVVSLWAKVESHMDVDEGDLPSLN